MSYWKINLKNKKEKNKNKKVVALDVFCPRRQAEFLSCTNELLEN